jgi:PadR family transcriptional regulator, regulatory protein PadR
VCNTQYNVEMKENSFLEIGEKLKQEIRRGITVVIVMDLLSEQQYGYSLLKQLNDNGVEIGQDTLYPLLRRLEEQELLDSEWRMDGSRPRRYYRLNQQGTGVLAELKTELKMIDLLIRRIT